MSTRLIIFWALLICFGALELVIPARAFSKNRVKRTLSNVLIVIINNGILLLMPLIPMSAAVMAKDRGYGLMNILKIEGAVELILCVLVLDLTIYWQHRWFHTNKYLRRVHRMHHMEPLLEVSSGFRFHPFEIIISNVIKIGVVFALGVSPITILVFEVWLSSIAMFNHANIRIPNKMESFLRHIVFTPLKHNVHHSLIQEEASSNYGFSVPWWDRLFGSYRTEGKRTIDEIAIGVPGEFTDKVLNFPGMLLTPFKN